MDELNNGLPQPEETIERETEVAEPEVDTTQPEVTEPPKFKVKYNHEEKELSYDEAVTYAQKGMNYDKALEKTQQLEKDYQIAKKYGAEYGVYSEEDIKNQYGINTFDDFEKAVQRQKYIDKGIDPDILNEAINNNPDVQYAKEMRAKQNQQNYLANQVKALEEYSPGIDVSKLDPSIVKDFELGKPLVDAYIKWENSQLKTKLQAFEQGNTTIQANIKNAESTPGSTTGNGTDIDQPLTPESIATMSEKELSRRWPEVKKIMNMR